MIRAVILTHGDLGAALMKSVESMLGPQQETVVLSNSGKAIDQIMDSVTPHLADSQTLIFVDFCGGSPFMACKMLPLSADSTHIVSGVNLPMLLSFFTKRESLNFEELARVVQDDGHRGIQLHCE